MSDVKIIEIDSESRYLFIVSGTQMTMEMGKRIVDWFKSDEPMFCISIPGGADIRLVRVEREA